MQLSKYNLAFVWSELGVSDSVKLPALLDLLLAELTTVVWHLLQRAPDCRSCDEAET